MFQCSLLFFRPCTGLCTRQVPRHLPALLQDRCKWRQRGDRTVDPCRLQMPFGSCYLCKILKSHLKCDAVVHAETNQRKQVIKCYHLTCSMEMPLNSTYFYLRSIATETKEG